MADNNPRGSPSDGQDRPPERTNASPALIRSQDLFGAAQEVVIEHNQRSYRLRITGGGKLILTA